MKQQKPWSHGRLVPSKNRRIIEHTDGTPFFWLGDTGWRMFHHLTREEAVTYLDDRKSKGFNVIQVIIVHTLPATNIYGSTFDSFKKADWEKNPSFSNPDSYWNVIDSMVDLAEERGIYMAMVPGWNSVVFKKQLNPKTANKYGFWLGRHFRERPNVIWLIGGDIRGNYKPKIWHALGNGIKTYDDQHIMTFHPFGRCQSSMWFHNSPWLDFNMFQSGHRRYDQRSLKPNKAVNKKNTEPDSKWNGEDNWRYVLEDLALKNPKPTIDGEPSYEGIPQGLHDFTQPVWTDADIRRYAYWSVFAGAFGFTYGNNAVMQMYKPQFSPGKYNVSKTWNQALSDSGACQMQHLRNLMESIDYRNGAHAPEIIVSDIGKKYDRLLVNKGPNYAVVYAYRPRPINVNLKRAFPGIDKIKTRWFNPVDGTFSETEVIHSSDNHSFIPPSYTDAKPGSDLVLVLTRSDSFQNPGNQ